MISWMKNWIRPPVFEGEEEKSYRASLLNAILMAGLFFICLVLIGNLLDRQTPIRNYVIDLVILVLVLHFRRELFKGRIGYVGIGQLVAEYAAIIAIIASDGTVRAPATASFILLVIVAGLLFDTPGVVVATLAASLAVAGLVWAQNANILPRPDLTVSVMHWFVFTVTFGLTGGLVLFAQRLSSRALKRSMAEVRKRERIEAELRKLVRAVEQSPASVVITDLDGNIEYVNPSFTNVTGYSLEDALGQNPRFLKTDLTPLERHRRLWETISAGGEWRGEFVNRRKDGSLYYESAIISVITDRDGVPTHYLAVKEDISERKRHEDDLRASEARYRSLFEQTHDAVFIMGLDGKYLAANQRAADMLGYSMDEVLELSVAETSAEPVKTESVFTRLLAGEDIPLYERNFRKKDGQVFPAEVNLELVRAKDGNPLHIQSVIRDISQRKQAEDTLKVANQELNLRIIQVEKLQAELREQALRDALTGLYNRRYLNDALERELKRVQRENSVLSVITMDTDFFKHINDTYGHQVGDRVLVEIAGIIRKATRGSDFSCRYGGEEFLLVLPGAASASAEKRAEEIRQTCEELVMLEKGHELRLTISFGVATYPMHGHTSDEILIKADKALYQSKRTGRNRVTIWEPGLG